jgi:hypothetical protein
MSGNEIAIGHEGLGVQWVSAAGTPAAASFCKTRAIREGLSGYADVKSKLSRGWFGGFPRALIIEFQVDLSWP